MRSSLKTLAGILFAWSFGTNPLIDSPPAIGSDGAGFDGHVPVSAGGETGRLRVLAQSCLRQPSYFFEHGVELTSGVHVVEFKHSSLGLVEAAVWYFFFLLGTYNDQKPPIATLDCCGSAPGIVLLGVRSLSLG